MAGTDRSRSPAPPVSPEYAPAVVLVRPQLGENIGMAARAMLNTGLTDLRLVCPRDGWPSPMARAASAGAAAVVDGATLFDTTVEAVADLGFVLASTARERRATRRVLTAGAAALELQRATAGGARTGVIFGPEARGLDNDDLALADAVVMVPLNPAFVSLNLAQAVLLVGYEWYRSRDDTPALRGTRPKGTRPATKAELQGFFEHLERELDASGFLDVREKRPIMVRNLRNLFQRAGLTEQEVRTLRGVITGLVGGRRK